MEMFNKIVKWSTDKKWLGKVVHIFIYCGEVYYIIDTSFGEKKSQRGLMVMRKTPNIIIKD